MRERPSIAEQHANACVYFNGITNDKCDAEITYPREWKDNPCHKSHENIPCEKRRFPTQEEVEIFVKELELQFENMKKAFVIVGKIKNEHKSHNWEGVEVCPVCNGKLHMSHSAFNGHVWGKCETEKCLAWME